MSLPLVLHPDVPQDILDAYDWYERQKEDLGEDFLVVVRAALDRIRDRPEMYPFIGRRVRRCVLPRFPYVIYYRLEPTGIRILAIYHGHRRPGGWRKRLVSAS